MGNRRKAVETNVDEKKSGGTTRHFDNFDSSDEEDLRNTIGNIPVAWYDDCEHIGYDKEGEPIKKPPKKGEMDAFLEKMEDPDYWRKVFDRQSGQYVPLSDEQVEQLTNIETSRYPTIGYNPYQPFLDIYSSKTEIHPISNRPDSKASFLPSRDEMRLVGRIVHAIKMGWIKPRKPKELQPKVYDLWADEEESSKSKSELARLRMHIPAPKVALPGHAESYNPPAEYLFTDDERKKWEESEPDERRQNFVPQKYTSLRLVPSYDKFFNERFERCLDLYLAPRQMKMKLKVDPSQLLPDLPNPADLRPFPTTLSFYMYGHKGRVCSVSFEPETGELLASGGDDGVLRIWSVMSGHCVKELDLGGAISSVAYSPKAERTLVAACVEPNRLVLLNTGCGDRLQVAATSRFLAELDLDAFSMDSTLKWTRDPSNGNRVSVELPLPAKQVVWHAKGDYFATFASKNIADAIYIHQLSKCKSQAPFSRVKGTIMGVLFHPRLPHFFVATQRHIRVYDLAKCQLWRKLVAGSRWVSCMDSDTSGENLFIGGLDRSFAWIDVGLSTKPWKCVRHHDGAIRSIAFHHKYPLLATVSDDSSAIVYHARCSADAFKESELVPVRRLRGHDVVEGLSMLSTAFHPSLPWLVTGGADGRIALFTD